MTASTHLSRYPKARASTLALLQLRDAKTQQLRQENEQARIEASKPKARLMAIVGKINALIGKVA